MYCDFLLNKHIEKQFKAFKRGFDRVVDTQLIKVSVNLFRCSLPISQRLLFAEKKLLISKNYKRMPSMRVTLKIRPLLSIFIMTQESMENIKRTRPTREKGIFDVLHWKRQSPTWRNEIIEVCRAKTFQHFSLANCPHLF